MQDMREMISRLIEWLKAHGMTDAEIVDCIKQITQ